MEMIQVEMKEIKTSKGRSVVTGKLYELKYEWGDSYKYGIGWINPNHNEGKCVDILRYGGGVTYQSIENVIFIKQIKQITNN